MLIKLKTRIYILTMMVAALAYVGVIQAQIQKPINSSPDVRPYCPLPPQCETNYESCLADPYQTAANCNGEYSYCLAQAAANCR